MILGLTSDKYDTAKLYDEPQPSFNRGLSQIQGGGTRSTPVAAHCRRYA